MGRWLGTAGLWLLSVLLAFAAGLVASLLEPVKRQVERLGRRFFEPNPFDVIVETDLAVIWAGHLDWFPAQFHYPGGVPTEPPPATLGEWQEWVRSAGGYDYGCTTVKVTLVAKTPSTVLVNVPVVRAIVSDAPTGAALTRPVGGASVHPLGFDVHLGVGSSWVALTGPDGNEPRESLSWSLGKGEVQSFLIRGLAEQPGLWDWTVEFPVYVDGKRRTVKVDDKGKSFRTVGGSFEATDLRWYGGEWH